MKIVFSGIISIIMGLLCFYPFLFSDMSISVINESNYFIGKYFIFISLISVASYFLVIGTLILFGKIVPYMFSDSKLNKKKLNTLGEIFIFPIMLSASVIIYELSESNMWRIVWVFLIILYCYSFTADIKYWLKNNNEHKGSGLHI